MIRTKKRVLKYINQNIPFIIAWKYFVIRENNFTDRKFIVITLNKYNYLSEHQIIRSFECFRCAVKVPDLR